MNPSDKIGKWFRRTDLEILRNSGIKYLGDLLSNRGIGFGGLSDPAKEKIKKFVEGYEPAPPSDTQELAPHPGVDPDKFEMNVNDRLTEEQMEEFRKRTARLQVAGTTRELILRQAGVRSRITTSIIGECHAVAVALHEFLEKYIDDHA